MVLRKECYAFHFQTGVKERLELRLFYVEVGFVAAVDTPEAPVVPAGAVVVEPLDPEAEFPLVELPVEDAPLSVVQVA